MTNHPWDEGPLRLVAMARFEVSAALWITSLSMAPEPESTKKAAFAEGNVKPLVRIGPRSKPGRLYVRTSFSSNKSPTSFSRMSSTVISPRTRLCWSLTMASWV